MDLVKNNKIIRTFLRLIVYILMGIASITTLTMASEQIEVDGFQPNPKLFQHLHDLIVVPQQIVNVDRQYIIIDSFQKQTVCLSWTWVSLKKSPQPQMFPGSPEGIAKKVDVIEGEIGVKSFPHTPANNNIFRPRNDDVLLKQLWLTECDLTTIYIKNLIMPEACWLLNAFKDNPLYQEAPVLHRLLSDIREGNISAKRNEDSHENGFEKEMYDGYENYGLKFLLQVLKYASNSTVPSAVNRLKIGDFRDDKKIVFSIRRGAEDAFLISEPMNLKDAKWFLDILKLHPAFPDASTYAALVRGYEQIS